ncbi:peptide chain release factor N(5)-glutamine methyltransferase [Aquamicrobium sp. LC103]|uniref:peptide chain release factor N(5)-glutamine methyltransferase n=1 Tax=Aquamicrobium sp. LC103 TaxID=1120658 RepID=UPI00063E96DF|nr:peptide chain release factor N(5)-glutamine methyltransferase [Aquamicrobium sp. LC103]TKT75217.1 peptide chain release factor N(5)-glutamine methyltransferase [Aquamicrobium sp. LC103]
MPDDRAPRTLGALLAYVRKALENAGKAEAALDARILVEHFTGASRTDAVLDPGRAVGEEAALAVTEALRRRLAGEPVYRILGFREFHGLKLSLSSETLEPRPDTEALVDLVLPFVRDAAARDGACRILDLGTGTGAIALALLKEVEAAEAIGADISSQALATARANADISGNGGRFRTVCSDWFSDIEGRFHLVVSNPPYIRSDDMLHLQPEVRNFDPLRALDGGADGLHAYRQIAARANEFLMDGGLVAVEIGHDQREEVTVVFRAAGFMLADSTRDLAGNDRALAFRPLEAVQKTLGNRG